MNGKRGDAPYTDIVVYGETIFHPKVDQLIRDLSAVGAFSDPFARYYIDNAALIWSKPEAFLEPSAARNEKEKRGYTERWLRNFAFILWLRLKELTGEGQESEELRLPVDRDPSLP